MKACSPYPTGDGSLCVDVIDEEKRISIFFTGCRVHIVDNVDGDTKSRVFDMSFESKEGV
jgi:hypothetical protein